MTYATIRDTNGNIIAIQWTDDAGRVSTIMPGSLTSDWAQYQAWLARGNTPSEDLAYYKTQKIISIKIKTQTLLTQGFSYTTREGTSNYSLDPASMQIWNWLKLAADASVVAFPRTIYDINSQAATLQNLADVHKFFSAAMARFEVITVGEGVLINRLNIATNKASIDAIVDNRT